MLATALCAISAIPLGSVATSPAPVTLLGAVACIDGFAGEPLLAQPLGPAPHRFFRRDILLHRYCALDALPLATGLKCFLLFGILDHNALLVKSARQNTSRQNQINLQSRIEMMPERQRANAFLVPWTAEAATRPASRARNRA